MRFRIDLKIFFFLILFYITRQIEMYAMIMFFAIIHEIGHLIAGLIVGMKPEKLELMPFGISISFKININDYNKKINKGNKLELKKIFVALGGPLTNLIIILISYRLPMDFLKNLMIIYTNLLIMLFNLLPIYPLDGGRIIKSILHISFGKKKSEKYINTISFLIVSFITAIFSILILYAKNISILLIDLFLWGLIIKENIKYKKRQEIYKKILENVSN